MYPAAPRRTMSRASRSGTFSSRRVSGVPGTRSASTTFIWPEPGPLREDRRRRRVLRDQRDAAVVQAQRHRLRGGGQGRRQQEGDRERDASAHGDHLGRARPRQDAGDVVRARFQYRTARPDSVRPAAGLRGVGRQAGLRPDADSTPAAADVPAYPRNDARPRPPGRRRRSTATDTAAASTPRRRRARPPGTAPAPRLASAGCAGERLRVVHQRLHAVRRVRWAGTPRAQACAPRRGGRRARRRIRGGTWTAAPASALAVARRDRPALLRSTPAAAARRSRRMAACISSSREFTPNSSCW